MSRSRRILIIFLIVITVLLAAVSIFITIRLQQTQAPPDTSAACVATCTCNGTCRRATCTWSGAGCTLQPYGIDRDSCTAGCATQPGPQPGPTPQPQQNCGITYSGQFSADSYTCFTIPAGCPSVSGFKYTQSRPDATGHGNCVGTSTNQQATTFGPGTHCAPNGAGCGTCVQYDFPGGGVAGFTGACPTPKAQCGAACNATSDCATVAGKTVVCNPTLKMCVNASCPTNTISGAACNCPPPGSPSAAASCPTGSTTPIVTITWSQGTSAQSAQGFVIDIDNDNNFANGFWNKTITDPNTLSTTAPTGFTPFQGATGSLNFTSGGTYYYRVYYLATQEYAGGSSTGQTFTINGCVLIPETGIIDENPYVFFGIFLIIVGYLTYKLRLTYFDRNNLLINGFFEFKQSAIAAELDTSRRSYEAKLEKKLRRKLEA